MQPRNAVPIPIMKTMFLSALLPALAITAVAQQQEFQTPAVLADKGGGFSQVWVTAATKTAFRYKVTEVATETEDKKFADVEALYFLDPPALSQALDQFQGRKYAEAKAAFARIRELCKPVMAAPGNPGTLAAFYELECMRRTGDLEGLSAALKDFVKDPLIDATHLRQVELYVLWDAVRTKSWPRLATLVEQRSKTPLSPGHRAQLAYCGGLAMENLEKPDEALIAYSMAITADAGESDHVAREAALRILEIHSANEGVKKAIENWGTQDENKNSRGYADLIEAAAVAELFEQSLGGGAPLPDKFKNLLKFRVKPEAAGDA